MSGQKQSLLRRKLGVAPLPLAAVAAIVAGTLTLMIWQSPRSIVADVNPLVLDFGKAKDPSKRQWQNQTEDSAQQGQIATDGADAASRGTSNDSGASTGGISRRPGEPVRTQSSNGGLVLEWPRQRKEIDAAAADAKSQAQRILKEAEDYLRAGDLRRALNSARLAYSYPVKWQPGEQTPEELLTQLEALANDPTFVDAARQAAINKINSANSFPSELSAPGTARISDNQLSAHSHLASTDSSRPASVADFTPEHVSGIGVWKPAPASESKVAASIDSGSTQATPSQSDAEYNRIAKADVAQLSESNSDELAAPQPYRSQRSTSADTGVEPRRLDVATHRQVSESTADFATQRSLSPIERLDQRPLIITDQRAGSAQADSPIRTLTCDVLATLTTIFAVLFFGSLFVLLAVLAIGRKLLGEKGVSFRIELVNSPLTVQAGAAAAAPQASPAPAAKELTLPPDFEGILSMSEQRARQRESAILQQFIENNVSLHKEISASRSAA